MKTRKPPSVRRRRSERRSFVLAAVLAALAAHAGCSRGGTGAGDPIELSGAIEVTEATLAFKIPGRIVERLVDEGERVETGALIARLDAIELEQQLAVRVAELAAVQAALAELEAGSRTQEIAAASAAFRSAEADRDRLQLEFKRQEELRATQAASNREFEVAQAQLRVAEGRSTEAKERLALLREGPRKETLAQARARVQQAEAAVALARTQVNNARLEAPFPGVVIEKHAEPGEFLAAGAPVVSLANLENVWVRAYVAQTDLGRIRLGQSVDVRTDTYPDKVYTGRLSFISSEAEFTPKTVQTQKERVKLVFRVKIEIENTSGELKPGMAADASLAPAR